MKIIGNVFGQNVVGKHINQVMVNYIGTKKLKKMKIKLDLYGNYVLYSGRNGK